MEFLSSQLFNANNSGCRGEKNRKSNVEHRIVRFSLLTGKKIALECLFSPITLLLKTLKNSVAYIHLQ